MFSAQVFSDLPFAALPDSVLTDPGLQTFYLSTNGYTSGADDSVADQYFDARVQQALSFDRALVGDARVGGLTRGQGELVLLNGDRLLDTLLDGFALDGRRVTVRHGRSAFSYDAFRTVFRGVMMGVVATRVDLRIEVRDNLDRLNIPIQTNNYAGTGGNEGGADLEGKPKPLCFGQVFNVPAVLVDAANNVYQVAAHQINAVTAVRDRGVALNAAPSGGAGLGEYEVDLSTGLITLGGAPDGQITADVQGHSSPSYATATSDIVKRILESFGGFTADDMDLPSFADMASAQPATVGIWIGTEQRTIADIVDELLIGVGGFGAERRDGLFSVGVFTAPTGAALALTDEDMSDLSREMLPGSFYPPAWRQQVGYQKNYTVQNDIAGSVAAATRTAIANPYRIAAAATASVQLAHLLAPDPPYVLALFANAADAEDEATRLNALYSTTRSVYRFRLGRKGFGLNLNQVVHLTYPALGLDLGKYGRVIGLRDDAASRDVEVTVFV